MASNDNKSYNSEEITQILGSFAQKGYKTAHFATGAEAAAYLNAQIDQTTVAFGDSRTLFTMGVYDLLVQHNQVIDPMHPPAGQSFFDVLPQTTQGEVFLTSVNAATVNGELVNIDAVGNRVAGTLYGHQRVYFVFSVSKLCPTLEEAVWRARNIAAPQNTARKKYRTPCAVKGDHCYDCRSPERICNALVLHLHCLKRAKAEIVLIDEALGF